MFEYRLEHIFSFTARLQNPPEAIGPVGEGLRINFYVTGGKVSGPKVKGIIRPVGGDWITIRADGVGIVDVRATIETHDHALIYLSYTGVGDLGEDGQQKFLQGIFPPKAQVRIALRFQSAHPAYKWLNRLQCVGIGEADLQHLEVSYDIYALR
jgi:hypothetical protein